MAKDILVFVNYQRQVLIPALIQVLPDIREKLSHLDFSNTILVSQAETATLDALIAKASRITVVEVMDALPRWHVKPILGVKRPTIPFIAGATHHEIRQSRHHPKENREGYWIVTYIRNPIHHQLRPRSLDAPTPFQFLANPTDGAAYYVS